MCLYLGYLALSPDAFGYDLTSVGNQEAERLFALPSVLFRHFEGVTDPKLIVIFNRLWSCVSEGVSGFSEHPKSLFMKKIFAETKRIDQAQELTSSRTKILEIKLKASIF